MKKKVEEYMERYHMIEEGDSIVAGISGGADSVCLFYLLNEYCKKKSASFSVVHINHGIRKEAAKDAEFVENLCSKAGVPFHLFEKDIPLMAKELGMGTEEAGRKVRYEAFEEVRTFYGEKAKIAVAHNRNDQAETTLFHLFRGAGIVGLSGIAPVRDSIIRPLLCVERSEIENYLVQNRKNWCIDSTNQENTYTRNKLRNVVFPYVEKEICEQSTRHVANAAEEIARVREYLEVVTEGVHKEIVSREDGFAKIQIEPLQKQHEVIQKQLLLQVLAKLVPARKDFGAVHIRDILSLLDKNSGKQIHLPYGYVARREFDVLTIGKEPKAGEAVIFGEENTALSGPRALESTIGGGIELLVPGKIELQRGKYLECVLISQKNIGNIPQKTYTKWFDYDKIISCPVVRSRKQGDYLTITRDGKKKTIKEYFIEEKVPRGEREHKLLLADGNHIIWVIGMRISEAYKITGDTKRILQVTFFEENK